MALNARKCSLWAGQLNSVREGELQAMCLRGILSFCPRLANKPFVDDCAAKMQQWDSCSACVRSGHGMVRWRHAWSMIGMFLESVIPPLVAVVDLRGFAAYRSVLELWEVLRQVIPSLLIKRPFVCLNEARNPEGI